ncbi:MAG: ribosome maturation factor RimP [Chlorobiaceae bacterium]|nr:ribosome maturation factor RimP [Chlorobiaceae bacterium]
MDERIRTAIDESMAEVSAGTGQEIYLVDSVVRGGGRTIELTVDTDKGIIIDQCAKLSRKIRARLESFEDDLMMASGEFDLLVSSPGIGEPVKVKRQYVRHLGRLIRISHMDSDGERQEIDGRLLQAAVGDEEEPFIVIEPIMQGKKKRKADVPPMTIRLADIVKAVVQTEL